MDVKCSVYIMFFVVLTGPHKIYQKFQVHHSSQFGTGHLNFWSRDLPGKFQMCELEFYLKNYVNPFCQF